MKKTCLILITLFLCSCAHISERALPYFDGACPRNFPVKGNDSSNGFIYHTYESEYYDRVNAEWCFTTEKEASTFGYRRFKVWRSYPN